MYSIILLLVFASFIVLAYQLFGAVLMRTKPIERLKRFEQYKDNINIASIKDNKPEKKQLATKLVSEGLKKSGLFKKYIDIQKDLLFNARSKMKIEEYITLKLILVLFWLVLFFFAFSGEGIALLLAIVSIPIVWVLPEVFLKIKIKKRMERMNAQLGDAIRILSNSLKAGYGFIQALTSMVKEMDGPIAEEFGTVLNEIRIGDTVDNALENLSIRIGNADLGMVVTAVLIQRQMGGNLSEVLDNIAETISGRVALKRELSSATAQGRMSAIVISSIPPILFVYCMIMNRELYSMLLTSSIGIMMLVGSLLMELLGIFFIRKIIKIKI